MNKPLLITAIICLGVPFILSLKSSRSRAYRRKAIAAGFCVMLGVAVFLPADTRLAASGGENVRQEDGWASGWGSPEREPATCYMASDVDLSGYSDTTYIDMNVSNYKSTSKSSYPINNVFDGDPDTCWQDGVEGYGEGTEFSVTFSESTLQYIVFYNGRVISEDKFWDNARVCQMEISNGKFTEVVELPDVNAPVAIKLDGWEEVSFVHFKINSVYPGNKYDDTCISEIIMYR